MAKKSKTEQIIESEVPRGTQPASYPGQAGGPGLIDQILNVTDFGFSNVGADPSQPNQEQLRKGAEEFHGLSSEQWAGLSDRQKAEAIWTYVNSSSSPQFSDQTFAKVKKEEKAATAPKQPNLPALAQPQASPYDQLAQSLASDYLRQVQQLEPLISGEGIFGPGQLTDQAAAVAKTAVPGASDWLAQQVAAEQTAAKPLAGAMQAEGNALAAGAVPFAGAIGQSGQANTEFLAAAPWQQILNELANETAYKAASSYGAAAFGANTSNTPAFLQGVFKNLGLPVPPAGGASSSGLPGLPGAPAAAKKGGGGSTTGINSAQSVGTP